MLFGDSLMEQSIGTPRWVTCLLLVSAVLTVGCANLRLPRIDPSGRRIFLPPPAYTMPAGSPFGQLPQPAYVAPPTPPPCPAVVAPQGPALPSQNGQAGLLLSPTRLIVPVGRQIILKAGVCGTDGYYVTKQPIQWLLSEESVGQIVSVKDEGRRNLLWPFKEPAHKVTGSYAVARTDHGEKLSWGFGTDNLGDDRLTQAGETWVQVSSASEGISRITAYAPNAEPANRRQQTATIYWVDAQWLFPGPAILGAGQEHVLATTVTRASNSLPIEGAIVRYDILGGSGAGFGPARASAIEVLTDSQGVARVGVNPSGNQPGVVQIGIQVIQPASASNGYSRFVLGRGGTSVTWSAPKIELQTSGPARADLDSTVSFQINVSNAGDLPASGVIVTDQIPPGMAFLNSQPPADVVGSRIRWNLGNLPRGDNRLIEFNCRVKKSGRIHHCAKAVSSEGLSAEGCWTTSVVQPTIRLSLTGPETADVGERIQYKVVVTNVSDQPLSGVIARDEFGIGLSHARADSPIERLIGDLAPGQSNQFAVTFTVTRPGTSCHTLEVRADGGHVSSTRACIAGRGLPSEPQPAMTLRKRGPGSKRVGEVAEFQIELTNSGELPITNVRVADLYPESLRPRYASPDYSYDGKSLVWEIRQIPVGETITKTIQCECVAEDSGACSRVTVTADGELTLADESCLEIFGEVSASDLDRNGANGLSDPRGDPYTDQSSHDGALQLTITDLSDPVRAGQSLTYLIGVKNSRSFSDKNVVVTLVLPVGMRLHKIAGPAELDTESRDRRTIRMRPIAELRAGEEVLFRAEVKTVQAGPMIVESRVESLRSIEVVSQKEETTIFDP